MTDAIPRAARVPRCTRNLRRTARPPATAFETQIIQRRRFLLTSHARPDGDSIGSQLAMAYALKALGKEAVLVNRDVPPAHYFDFPGVADIVIADAVDPGARRVRRAHRDGVRRLSREPASPGWNASSSINIDHHIGNSMFGALNWFDETASACGELVYELVVALGVPLTEEIATHIYLAILTDTGSFHHSNITPRTFEICRRAASRRASSRPRWRAACSTATATES